MATPPPDDRSGSAPTGRRGGGGAVKRVSSNPSRPTGGQSPASGRARPPGQPHRGAPPGHRPASRPPGSRPPGSRPTGPRPAGGRPPSGPPAYVAEAAPLGESSWKAFFRPVKSSRAGTMPAGMVLVIVIASLLISMFASADAISRKSSGRRNNAAYRTTIAADVAKFADTFRLTAPANSAACAAAPYLGRTCFSGESNKTTEELLAEQGGSSDATAVAAPTGGPPTTIDKTPKLRAPTAANPLKVWVGGDSISYDPGIALTNFSGKTKLYSVTVDARASTGLVRDDYFNWPAHLVKDVTPTKPDVVFIMFGGNDAQGIITNGGAGGILYGTPEWQTTYRKRVGDTMDLLRSSANDRLVVWMGMPPVGETSGVKNVPMLNYIYATEAAKRPWVKYFDSWPFFAAPDGSYALTLPSADGSEHVMRAKDNVHFSEDGAMRFGWAVYARFSTLVDLSAAPPLVPDPTEAPPPDIKERTDIPMGEGQIPA